LLVWFDAQCWIEFFPVNGAPLWVFREKRLKRFLLDFVAMGP